MPTIAKENPNISGDIKFEWGQKAQGQPGKDSEIQCYRSFTYDDVKYSVYDSVYMWTEGQPSPYIGKIIKIFETPSLQKKVKVVWYFHPTEVQMWLKGTPVLDNELFLASGEGHGLYNVNFLESISGKCRVVCTSKDARNPEASEEELKMSDYVFSRTFDVKECRLSESFPDKIAGLEVGNFFNPKSKGISKVTAVKDEDSASADLTNKTVLKFPVDNAGRRQGSSSSGACDSYLLKKRKLRDIEADDRKDVKTDARKDVEADERKNIKAGSQSVEFKKRSKVDPSEWFKKLPWEERMQIAMETGTLVLLDNLYPSFTSSEVEDIVLYAFKTKASAKMIPQTLDSRPNNGQAFVIFKTKEKADFALSELKTKCLMIGLRPVVGSRPSLKEPGNNPSKSFGRITIGRKQWMDRKNAVSTSHFAQPNTIAFDMAMEWMALQKKSELCWDALAEQQSKEMADLKALLNKPQPAKKR